MAYKGYVNKEVQAMYGIPYSQLTAEQKRILHEDSKRRAKLIEETQQQVMKNNLKAFEDEAKLEEVLGKIYRDCQKQILAEVSETIAKVEKAGGTWSYANQSALTRSRGLFEQITAELNKLGQKEQAVFTQGLGNIYTDQFLRQVYTLGQSITVKANFNRLNPALIKRTLDYPWSGAMFSDRIWQDKEKLGRNLREGLTQSMILGEGIPEITERINKNIGTAQYNAERVARTETKRVTYVAHNDVYEDTGVEKLRYYTSGMKSASEVCGTCKKDNGKIFDRGKEPTLPRHPNCKCVYVPVVEDTFKAGELNELTHSVRGAENYEKWIKANKDKINPDGSLKDGWVRDWKNGGKLINTSLKEEVKNDKVTLSKVDPIKLTDYPQPFYATKAEAKNTQTLLDFINNAEKADPDVVGLYRYMEKAYNFLEKRNIPFSISHGKNHAVTHWTRIDGRLAKVRLCIPKLTGENIMGAVDTTLHEEMHFLDFLLGKDTRDGISGAWVSATNTKLTKALSTSTDTIGEKVKALFKQHDDEHKKISAEMREKYKKDSEALYDKYFPYGLFGKDAGDYDKYKKELAKIKSSVEDERDYRSRNIMGGGIGNLQDIYDALSKGRHRNSGAVTYGHGTKYYAYDTNCKAEILANYATLSVAHPELLDLLAEDKPVLVEALRDVVKEMLKEVE